MSEKNEKPTSKRLRDARKKGQIAKSIELTSAVQLSCMAIMLLFFAPDWFNEIVDVLDKTLEAAIHTDFHEIQQIVISCCWLFAKIISVVGCIILAGTLGIQFAQVGFTLATEAFENIGQRINPMSNIKQIFSFNSLFELLKSILKLIVVSGLFASILDKELASVQNLSRCGAQCAITFSADLIFHLFLGLLSACVFFAIMDYAFQKRRITKQLMMSKEDIKQEFKNSEGNQEIKHQRKEIHRDMLQNSRAQNVRKSSFIIRNPTHIAICIRYDERSCPLPQVLDKAINDQARIIVALAEAESIPMVENVALARRLMKSVQAGQFITEDFYDELAAIIHFVEKIRKNKAPNLH